MTEKGDGRSAILRGVRVIDGGLATELEYQGARIDGPLWSAHVLEDEPEKLVAVYRAYIEAGAECIATCSYQVSRMGYGEVGLTAGAVAVGRVGARRNRRVSGSARAGGGLAWSLWSGPAQRRRVSRQLRMLV